LGELPEQGTAVREISPSFVLHTLVSHDASDGVPVLDNQPGGKLARHLQHAVTSAKRGEATARSRGLTRSLPSLGGVSLVVISLVLLLAGCAGTSDADAPYTGAGLNSVTGGGEPGQAEVVGVPTAIRTGSVVLESATLVPFSGFPLPHMVGVGLVTSKDWLAIGWSWPLLNAPVGLRTAPVRPLAGYVLTAGHPIAIYYAFRGDRAGQKYYVAGIRLKYRRGTQDYAVTLYQIGLDCVLTASTKVGSKCDLSPAALKQVEALPHP
jgi:hypothetical protein